MRFFPLTSSVVPPTVAGLPSTPFDGQEVYFQTPGMATDGVRWHLIYRLAASGSYKWEYVGGSDLYAGTDLDEQIPAATITYVALTTPVAVSIPAAGDYLVGYGTRFYPWSANQDGLVSVTGCGLSTTQATVDEWAAYGTGPNGLGINMSRFRRFTLTAGTLSHVYRHTNNTQLANFDARWLVVRPVRVG